MIRNTPPAQEKHPTTHRFPGTASFLTNLTSDFSQGDTGLSDFKSKLQHLSAEQIEALYNQYIGGERIALLLERYAIDIAPSSLIKAFPPVPCAELKCPYCEVSLFERRKSRSANSWNDNLAYCPNCAHRHYFPGRNKWQRECTCVPCQASRERARQAKAIEQRKRIHEHWSLAKRLPVPLHTLPITRQLQLLAMLEIRMDAQRDCIQAAEKTLSDARISPSASMDSAILLALHEDQILLVDPDSPLDAFSDDPTPKAWQNKVRWIANVSLDCPQRASVGPLYRTLHKALSNGPQPQWHDELVAAIKQLCNEEVCAYIATRSAVTFSVSSYTSSGRKIPVATTAKYSPQRHIPHSPTASTNSINAYTAMPIPIHNRVVPDIVKASLMCRMILDPSMFQPIWSASGRSSGRSFSNMSRRCTRAARTLNTP